MSDRSNLPAAPPSDELLRLIFESASDYAIFSMDPRGLVTSWNPGAEGVLGYAAPEIHGQTADVIFTPEDRAAGAPVEERQKALAVGRAEDDRWQMRKGGARFWASGLMMPLADRRLGFVKILRDRTEHHLAEIRHRRDEERFRLLATNIPQLVFRCLVDGTRTWPSPQWIEFTGVDYAASLGFGWLDAIHPDDRDLTVVAWGEAAATGEYHVEHRVRRAADGAWRWHQTRARAIEGEAAGDDWVGTMTDVHDLRDLQERQQVLMAELQHRTRNLLAIAQAIAAQTLRTSPSLEEFGAEYNGRLQALGRVQGLLARVDADTIDLGKLVRAELRAHGFTGAAPGKVQIEGPPVGLPVAAAQTLGLALHELATNAVKYGARSQPSGKLDVTWLTESSGSARRLVLDWTESGVDMPVNGRPARRGYGSELIERALPYQLGAETRLEFGPQGVRCQIAITLEDDEARTKHA